MSRRAARITHDEVTRMVKAPENPMVKFLFSLGIEPPADTSPCEYCGAEWPWCGWNFSVRDPPPCEESRKREGQE